MATQAEEATNPAEDTKVTLGWAKLPLIWRIPNTEKYLLTINGMQLECDERFIVNLTRAGLRALKAYNGLPQYND